MEKHMACIFCNRTIKGRSDKKFCDDNCRSRYNYGAGRRNSSYMITHINHTLKRNRRILHKLISAGYTKVGKAVLLNDGFDFEHHTSIINKSNNTFYWCYDLGYQIIAEDNIVLVKKEAISPG